tara:strand:+ start:523 stop:1278 length:756 start_codon:yes stop_codon:yes gene_type:complete
MQTSTFDGVRVLQIIGDIHNKHEVYNRELIAGRDKCYAHNLSCEEIDQQLKTVQIGDLTDNYTEFFDHLSSPEIDSSHNGVYDRQNLLLQGNHDPSKAVPCCLPRFGESNGVFWVSGAYSIDKNLQSNWNPDEELSMAECYRAVELYASLDIKPSVIISHDCPNYIRKDKPLKIESQTRTSDLLQALLEIHAPDIWVFGHHHTHLWNWYSDKQMMAIGLEEGESVMIELDTTDAKEIPIIWGSPKIEDRSY